MNNREKEAYLREYSILKSQGKPFFPYAVAKDSIMAVVVMASIIVMAIVLGAELGPKVDPTSTTYTPRPEWYFFFLFEVLRVIKPSSLTPLAAIGVPTICMILLFLLPFYDRSAERRPERRPIAMAAAFFTIAAMAFLTYEGAHAGSPNQIDLPTPQSVIAQGGQTVRTFEAGRQVVAQSGCLACHKIAENGGTIGPNLTKIGGRLPRQAIDRTLINPTAPMPSYASLPPDKRAALVEFLAQLKRWARRSRGDADDRDRQGHAAGAAGARDVRSHRRLLRRHELRHDGRSAPRLAPPRGRSRRGRARRPGPRRRDRHRRSRARARSAGRAGRRGDRLGLLGGDADPRAGQGRGRHGCAADVRVG
jgi:mono/diheme cytochrome c family protein